MPPTINLGFLKVLTVFMLGVFPSLLVHSSGWSQNSVPIPINSNVKSYVEQLTDDVAGNNETALRSLKQLGRDAVTPLIEELGSDRVQVRRTVVGLLGELGSDAKDAVKPLTGVLLNDKDFQVRRDAAQALGDIGSQAQDAINPLIAAMQNDKDQGVRVYAGLALARIAPTHPRVLGAWRKALKDDDLNIQKMAAYNLAASLSKLDRLDSQKLILNDARTLLNDESRWRMQLVGAIILGGSTQDIQPALQKFSDLLQSEDKEVRQQAAAELRYVAEQIHHQATNLEPSQLAEAEKGLSEVVKILNVVKQDLQTSDVTEKAEIEEIDQLLISLGGITENLNALSNRYLVEQLVQWMKQYWFLSGLLIYIVSFLSLWSALLLLRPLWLMHISQALLQIEKVPLPLPKWTQFPTLTRNTSLIIFFQHHPRVLDAWVSENLENVQLEFTKLPTVKDRSIHIPVPVILNGQDTAYLTSQHLQPEFAKKIARVLIWGEGGSGKTSLACEVARWAMSNNPQERLCRHRMLPILLELAQDLEYSVENEGALLEVICGRLRDQINVPEPISEEFLQQLLKQQRLLLIVDGFSEMSKVARRLIHPENPNFPINALVVTSRVEERLGGVNRTTLQPMRVSGNHLSEFMGSYLTYKGKRELFTDQEFFQACSHLSAIAANRDITVLLAKLYADQMIAVKDGTIDSQVPDTIPGLILDYLNRLNKSVVENKLNDRIIHQDAKIIAWECLKHNYQPTNADWETVLAALGHKDAESHLDYLENRLRVIQTIGPAKNHIRFALDPLAEYLACLYLVEHYKNDEQAWLSCLTELKAQKESDKIQGFLVALYDCCLANKEQLQLPNFLVENLEQQMNTEQNLSALLHN